VAGACHAAIASSVIHTVRFPRLTNAASYSDQFMTLGVLWRRLSLNFVRRGPHQQETANDRIATASTFPSDPTTTGDSNSTTHGLFPHQRGHVIHAGVEVLPICRGDARRHRTHAHDLEGPVVDDRRGVSGSIILFAGRIKPAISKGVPRKSLRPSIEYASWWVLVPSATCLGLGSMIG